MRSTYGLVGFPLGHSFSRKYFTAKFEKEGRDAEYLNFEIENIRDIRQIVSDCPTLQGFSVTIPHKQNIIPLLDGISEEACKIGAVNCVKIDRKTDKPRLHGFNTDVFGFKQSLQRFIPEDIHKALILGNGGAAKAVRYALESLHIESLTVSRSPKTSGEISYPEITGYLQKFKLIVNTTPLGTWPKTEECPDIPYDLLNSGHYLFDLVYNPETTTFMQQGATRGAHVRNGLEMLQLQAEKGWEIWTGPNF